MNIKSLPYRKEVTAYIINENKEFIVVFSSQKNRFCKTPAGGVEAGETNKQAIIREMKEELGIDIIILEESKNPYKWEQEEKRIIENKLKVRGSTGVTFIAKIDPPNQEIKIQEEEISGYKWIKKEDIDKYLLKEHQREVAKKVFEEFEKYF